MKKSETMQASATALWIRLIRHGKITAQVTVPCDYEGPQDALHQGAEKLDIGRPIWLEKHTRDWEQFSQVRFYPEDFVESVAFDRLEAEYINPQAPKRKSSDPRNAFS